MEARGIVDGIIGSPIKVEVNPEVTVNPEIQIVTPPELTEAVIWIKWTLIVIAVLLLVKLIKGNK
tara:strand:- start:23597 stop:23791 length:195 start_codon:yes stop_codon:yes gene_type:complete